MSPGIGIPPVGSPTLNLHREELLGENHMIVKDVKQLRNSDRRITGVSKNLRMHECLDEHVQMHPSRSKRRWMWTFFVVGWTAGIMGFVWFVSR